MPRVIISESEKTPQPYRFKLDHKVVKIGRGSDNDIVIQCRSTSSDHCTMERVKGGYILRDQESTNGIKQEEALMEIIDLEDGMEVLVGDVTLEFTLSEDELEELEQEEFTSQQKKKLPPIGDEEGITEDQTAAKPKAKHKSSRSSRSSRSREPREPRTSTAPTPETSGSYRPQPTIQSNDNPFRTLLIFILVIIAVLTGMTLRHKMRTGEFLPTKVMHWIKRNLSQQEIKTPENKGASGQTEATGETTQPAAAQETPAAQKGNLME